MIKETIRFKTLINMLPILMLIVYYYTTFVQSLTSFMLPLVLIFLWIITTIFTGGFNAAFNNKRAKWWILYMIIACLMSIIGFSSTNLNFQIYHSPVYFLPIIGYYINTKYNDKELKLLLFFGAIVYLVNIVQNIWLSNQMPELFVEETEHSEDLKAMKDLLNVATTGMVATTLLIIGSLCIIIANTKQKIIKSLTLAFVLLLLYYILFINVRGTTTILLAVMILGFFLASKEPHNNQTQYYMRSLLLLSGIAILFVIPVLLWLSQNVENESLAKRFGDIASLFNSQGDINNMNSGSFSDRIELSMTSLSSWLSSPISFFIGIGDQTQSWGGDLIKSGIGGHSEFCDCLGRYGLLGGFIFCNILKTFYKFLCSLTYNRSIVKMLNIIFVIFLLTGVFNNIFEGLMEIFVFMFLPIIVKLLSKELVTYEK